MVICLRFPYFAPSIEQRDDDKLQQAPLVIGGQAWQQGQVYAMSGQAVQQGVRLDMPLRQAHLYCPRANFIPSAPTRYEHVAQEIDAQLLPYSDRVEAQPTRPAIVYYMGLQGLGKAENRPKVQLKLAQEVGRTIRAQTDLPPAIGIATNKFTAYLTAKSTHCNHLQQIAANNTTDFLAAYSLNALSLPEKLQMRFHIFGLRTLGDLAALPTGDIFQQFGPLGVSLHRLAHGNDPRPVPRRREPQQATWQMVWDDPINNLQTLERVLLQAANTLATQLRAEQLCATSLALQMVLGDGSQRQMQRTLPTSSYTADELHQHFCALLKNSELACGVSELKVSLLTTRPILHKQLSLIPTETEEDEARAKTIAQLAKKYGPRSFCRIQSLHTTSRLAERRYQITEMPQTEVVA